MWKKFAIFGNYVFLVISDREMSSFEFLISDKAILIQFFVISYLFRLCGGWSDGVWRRNAPQLDQCEASYHCVKRSCGMGHNMLFNCLEFAVSRYKETIILRNF